MSTSKTPLELVREFRSSGAALTERSDALVLRGRFAAAADQTAWLTMAVSVPAPFRDIQIYDPEIGGDVGPDDPFDAERVVSITVVKPSAAGLVFFFFQDALAAYFAQPVEPTVILVADLPKDAAFHARGLAVTTWQADATLPSVLEPLPINPRKLVADHVPAREIPEDLSPWVLTTAPVVQSPAFQSWSKMAARRLLGGLVSSAFSEGSDVWFQVSGPPIFKIRADDPDIGSQLQLLTEAVTWVYLSGFDIEARHRLFSGELARGDRLGQAFADSLARGLDSAKIAYEAHVHSASRETLKALADLRKTVIEEAQKVTQRTQDMTAGLARDLAVSAAPFILKILGDAGKAATAPIAAGFYFAAAAFIALSFGLQWRINAAFMASQKASRQRWMQTLFTYISNKERDEIAEQPIEDAVSNYRETRAVLAVVYGILVGVLLTAGLQALQGLPQPPDVPSLAKPEALADRQGAPSTTSETPVSRAGSQPAATIQIAPAGSGQPTPSLPSPAEPQMPGSLPPAP